MGVSWRAAVGRLDVALGDRLLSLGSCKLLEKSRLQFKGCIDLLKKFVFH